MEYLVKPRKVSSRTFMLCVAGAAVLATLLLIEFTGTRIDVPSLQEDYAPVLAAAAVILPMAYGIYILRFPKVALEVDYNNEVALGRKRGELTFSLEGKTFNGVDCGKLKVIFLHGAVKSHEKRVYKPQRHYRGEGIKRLTGRKIDRIVERGVPVTDAQDIVELGWIGREVLGDPDRKDQLINHIKQPGWEGVIWLAPYIPDELYRSFLFQEKTLPEIESLYEGRLDSLTRNFTKRVTSLKDHYRLKTSVAMYEMVDVISDQFTSVTQAMSIVNYMLKRHPREVADTITALRLEGGLEKFKTVFEKKVGEFEEFKEYVERLAETMGWKPPEEAARPAPRARRGLRERLTAVTGGGEE